MTAELRSREDPRRPKMEERRTASDLALIKAAQKGWSVTVWLPCDVELPFLNDENPHSFTGTVESVDRYNVKFIVPDPLEESEQNTYKPWIAKAYMLCVIIHERKDGV